MMEFEFLILDFIQEYIKNPFLDFLMPIISQIGNCGFVWIVATLVLLLIPKYKKTGFALLTGLLVTLLVGNIILKPLIARARPFEIADGINLLIKAPTDFSFPSGHTLSSVVGASVLTMGDKRFGYVAIPLAVLVAFSRLYLYVHFLTDILGAIVIGALISTIIYFIFFKQRTAAK